MNIVLPKTLISAVHMSRDWGIWYDSIRFPTQVFIGECTRYRKRCVGERRCWAVLFDVLSSSVVLQGRLPIRVQLKGLTEADLYRILTEPKNNLIRQQVELMKTEGVSLVFDIAKHFVAFCI